MPSPFLHFPTPQRRSVPGVDIFGAARHNVFLNHIYLFNNLMELPLPFKGRAGVGMGVSKHRPPPPSLRRTHRPKQLKFF